MKLSLKRRWLSEQSTIGELFIDDAFECYTLEDVVREIKIAGKTAIPRGKYEIAISFSNRFQKPLPLLLQVPDFDGVRIHPGNTAADTEGCILVGKTRATDFVGSSRNAFSALFAKINDAVESEKVFIEIEDSRKQAPEARKKTARARRKPGPARRRG